MESALVLLVVLAFLLVGLPVSVRLLTLLGDFLEQDLEQRKHQRPTSRVAH